MSTNTIPTNNVDEALSYVMKNEFIPHSCQIFEEAKSKGMKPYGSGVLAYLNDEYFILTASHVVEHWTNEHQLFIKSRKGYISIVGEKSETIIEDHEKVDIAFIKLDKVMLPEIEMGYKFLPINKFRGHYDLIDAAQYCVVGFPEVNQRIDEKGVMQTGSSAYFMSPSKTKVYDHYKLKKENHICLEFKGKGTDIFTGETVKLKGDHYGLSGCGLWLIILTKTPSGFSYDFRLIGIMTDFRRSKYDCLFGNHIKLLLQGLKAFKLLNYREIPIK